MPSKLWIRATAPQSGGSNVRCYFCYHEGHEAEFDELSNRVIGCAIAVHRALGPGLLESAYEQCLAREFALSDIAFEVQAPLPVAYKGVRLDCGYRVDLFVEKKLIIELKVVDKFLPIHEAQILTYMKLAKVSIGLLMNFNVELLKEGGIKRFVL